MNLYNEIKKREIEIEILKQRQKVLKLEIERLKLDAANPGLISEESSSRLRPSRVQILAVFDAADRLSSKEIEERTRRTGGYIRRILPAMVKEGLLLRLQPSNGEKGYLYSLPTDEVAL